MLRNFLIIAIILTAKSAFATNATKGYFGMGFMYEDASLRIPSAKNQSSFNDGIFLSLGFTHDISPKFFLGFEAAWNMIWHEFSTVRVDNLKVENPEITSGTQIKILAGYRPVDEVKLYGGVGFGTRGGYVWRSVLFENTYLDSRGLVLMSGFEFKFSRAVGAFLEFEYYKGKTDTLKYLNGTNAIDAATIRLNTVKVGTRLYFNS